MGILSNCLIGILLLAMAAGFGFMGTNFLNNAYKQFKENNFLKSEDFEKLKPKFEVKISPIIQTIQKPNGTRVFVKNKYKKPLKEYVLLINIANNKSVVPTDVRIKFFFSETLNEIQSHPHIRDSSNKTQVSMLRFYHEKSPDEYKTIEDKPVESPITNKFNMSIQQITEGNLVINSNIADFYCEKWPRESDFMARVIVDLHIPTKLVKRPNEINTYSGTYWYEIQGKSYKEQISGKIVTNNKIGLAPTLQGRLNPKDLLVEHGTFTTSTTNLLPPKKGIIFEVIGDYYYFIYGIDEKNIYINRNDVLLEFPFDQIPKDKIGNSQFSIGWSPDSLSLVCHQEDDIIKKVEQKTTKSLPPKSLVKWSELMFP